jgi:hypothetical protein
MIPHSAACCCSQHDISLFCQQHVIMLRNEKKGAPHSGSPQGFFRRWPLQRPSLGPSWEIHGNVQTLCFRWHFKTFIANHLNSSNIVLYVLYSTQKLKKKSFSKIKDLQSTINHTKLIKGDRRTVQKPRKKEKGSCA